MDPLNMIVIRTDQLVKVAAPARIDLVFAMNMVDIIPQACHVEMPIAHPISDIFWQARIHLLSLIDFMIEICVADTKVIHSRSVHTHD
jgi:hypothetical protein